MHRGNNERHGSNYYGGDSLSSIDEYLERVIRMQRMPSVTGDYPEVSNGHEFISNNSLHPQKHGDHGEIKILHANNYHHAPEINKKVHFTEHEKIVEIDRDGTKREVYDEKTIDVEADGFIQQKHKNFEMSKWDTFKAY